MSFQPSVSLTEQISNHLSEEIICGKLAPGERIQELKVAKELGVSRGSVREALLILESRYLIEIIPRRGAVVCPLPVDQIGHLCELNGELLSYYFRKLSERFQGELVRFHDAIDDMRVAIENDSADEFIASKVTFMRAGFEMIDDFYLIAALKGIVSASQRLSYVLYKHPDFDPRDTLRYTQALLMAVQNRDATRIDELVKAHCRHEARLGAGDKIQANGRAQVCGSFG